MCNICGGFVFFPCSLRCRTEEEIFDGFRNSSLFLYFISKYLESRVREKIPEFGVQNKGAHFFSPRQNYVSLKSNWKKLSHR